VIAGIDHRETAFSAKAFDAMFAHHRQAACDGVDRARGQDRPQRQVSGYGIDNARARRQQPAAANAMWRSTASTPPQVRG